LSDAPQRGLGLDAGGSRTRWALADATGQTLAQGEVAGMSGLQMQSDAGRAALRATVQSLAQALVANGPIANLGLYGGFTGLGGPAEEAAMLALLQDHLPLAPGRATLTHDMDIAYRAAYAPGEGYLVYAGTGSIAAFIDAQGRTLRAGGRGPALGDEGAGYWIAREALAWVWHQEDRRPGAYQDSPMAQRLLAAVGGTDWQHTRSFMYGSDRGRIGALALEVAAASQEDPVAHALLLRAGAALAELALHLISRCGPRPVTAAGRALLLSPLVEQGMRAALGPHVALVVRPDLQAHVTAARLALQPPR